MQIRFKLLTEDVLVDLEIKHACSSRPVIRKWVCLLFITLHQIKKTDLAPKIPIVQAPCFVEDLRGHSASLRRWDKSLRTRPQLFVAKGKISKRSRHWAAGRWWKGSVQGKAAERSLLMRCSPNHVFPCSIKQLHHDGLQRLHPPPPVLTRYLLCGDIKWHGMSGPLGSNGGKTLH